MAERRTAGGDISEAFRMLETFVSVGAERFDVTFTNLFQQKSEFLSKRTLPSMRYNLPGWVKRSAFMKPIQADDSQPILAGENLIIRPHRPPAVLLIQLDDLDADALEKARPVSFMILSTSPGNHQAWVAVDKTADAMDGNFTRRVRKASAADPTASGATRTAGTGNFKTKYAPDFPAIQIAAAEPGRIVTPDQLERIGLVAAPEPPRPAKFYPSHQSRRARGVWPSYAITLAGAPKSESGGIKRSYADFTWCLTAIDWGWSVEDVADRLMFESTKAQENGPGYAFRQATSAAEEIERRYQQREFAP